MIGTCAIVFAAKMLADLIEQSVRAKHTGVGFHDLLWRFFLLQSGASA